MWFVGWILQNFGRLKKHSVPNHRPVTALGGNILLNYPLDNENVLRQCKLRRYNIFI
jgi:hypothetical protein